MYHPNERRKEGRKIKSFLLQLEFRKEGRKRGWEVMFRRLVFGRFIYLFLVGRKEGRLVGRLVDRSMGDGCLG